MTDRPIIFSAPMVRALLDGRKTQTRRVLGKTGGDVNIFSPKVKWSDSYVLDPGNKDWRAKYTPYASGDRLYVREAHAMVPSTAYRMSEGVTQAVNPKDRDRACIYREGWDRSTGGLRWRPSIHMPRWASRLTLIITDVRVQRLQAISEADAIAEGIKPHGDFFTGYGKAADQWMGPLDSFASLWISLHGYEGWDENPWVVALTFDVVRQNIDQMPGVVE